MPRWRLSAGAKRTATRGSLCSRWPGAAPQPLGRRYCRRRAVVTERRVPPPPPRRCSGRAGGGGESGSLPLPSSPGCSRRSAWRDRSPGWAPWGAVAKWSSKENYSAILTMSAQKKYLIESCGHGSSLV
nr:putative uncharacterized protein FLJ34945 [Zootoca vivipara]